MVVAKTKKVSAQDFINKQPGNEFFNFIALTALSYSLSIMIINLEGLSSFHLSIRDDDSDGYIFKGSIHDLAKKVVNLCDDFNGKLGTINKLNQDEIMAGGERLFNLINFIGALSLTCEKFDFGEQVVRVITNESDDVEDCAELKEIRESLPVLSNFEGTINDLAELVQDMASMIMEELDKKFENNLAYIEPPTNTIQ